MNPTIEKFGYPHSLVRAYENWVVLARPQQATLGALILAHRSGAQSFAALDAASFTELGAVVADIETGLHAFRRFEKINYLMLMMVDREVHFHVLPRYAQPVRYGDEEFRDPGWPRLPDLSHGPTLDDAALEALAAAIGAHWPGANG